MTAEIAILNKSALALAADSAVTISGQGDQKIYNTVNKLFTLSKFQPVGIMVYGSGSFMGLPWETIIKIYRTNLGEAKLNTLEEYANGFIDFLNANALLFPMPQQDLYFKQEVTNNFRRIVTDVRAKVRKEKLQDAQIPDVVAKMIETKHGRWNKAPMLPSFPADFVAGCLKKHGDTIETVISEVFEKIPLTPQDRALLRELAALLPCKDIFQNYSGVVIAGFGEQEFFPAVCTFHVQGKIDGHLKYKKHDGKSGSIQFNEEALIIPFAQDEMARTFIEGIDPALRNEIEEFVQELTAGLPDLISKSVTPNLGDAERAKLTESFDALVSQFSEQLKGRISESHVDPLMNAVTFLPKEELASMAEALVSLTSFKQKVTMQAETVGGPVDVAVISKGDGFVWIKRKHYFKPELNSAFFQNYLRTGKQ